MFTPQFRLYQEQTFDSFCKKTIRNESIDAYRELAHRAKYEVQLSALPISDWEHLEVEDSYHPYQMCFSVMGHNVKVCDRELAEAIQYLIPQHRHILLLYYFLEYTDLEIGYMLGISNHAVRIRRDAALRHLQTLLEGKGYE